MTANSKQQKRPRYKPLTDTKAIQSCSVIVNPHTTLPQIFPTILVRMDSAMPAMKETTADYKTAHYRKTNVIETLIFRSILLFLIPRIA